MREIRVIIFWSFFETTYTCSTNSFSKTIQWILMIFCAKSRWSLACFVSLLHCSVALREADEKFEQSKKVCFFRVNLLSFQHWPHELRRAKCLQNYGIMQYYTYPILRSTKNYQLSKLCDSQLIRSNTKVVTRIQPQNLESELLTLGKCRKR